jgi:hypothetical protein
MYTPLVWEMDRTPADPLSIETITGIVTHLFAHVKPESRYANERATVGDFRGRAAEITTSAEKEVIPIELDVLAADLKNPEAFEADLKLLAKYDSMGEALARRAA